MLRTLLICLISFWASSAAAELSIDGPCAQDHRWTATLINQGGGGVASYNQCAPSFDMAYFRCSPGSRTVDFTIENTFANLPATSPLLADMVVGATRYPLRGSATFSEMTGSGTPTFTLDRADPVFTAMAQGSTAQITLAGTPFSMHLTGASDILTAMFEACP